MEIVIWALGGVILLCAVVAVYAAREVLFHNRNVQLILSGKKPREHQGYARIICELITKGK